MLSKKNSQAIIFGITLGILMWFLEKAGVPSWSYPVLGGIIGGCIWWINSKIFK